MSQRTIERTMMMNWNWTVLTCSREKTQSLAAVATLLGALALSLGISACDGGDVVARDNPARMAARADGGEVTIAAPSDLIGAAPLGLQRLDVQANAPGRVVANTIAGSDGAPLIIFDIPEVASLYSTYRQNLVAADRAAKGMARTRDLFAHEAATGKDVADAEAEHASAVAAVAETESRLRLSGFNPADLRRAGAGSLWVICDVPESQLADIRKGEPTRLMFASYPGETFAGRVDAIGDVVDNTTRTVRVRVVLSNPGNRLKPGMYASATFGTIEREALAVPTSAVVTVMGRNYVFVRSAPTHFIRREVEIGRQYGDSVVLTSGVRSGEEIVNRGTMLLKGLSFGY